MKEVWIARNPANKKYLVLETKEEADKLFPAFGPIIHLVEERKIYWDKVWKVWSQEHYQNDEADEKPTSYRLIQDLVEKSLKGEL